MDSQPFAGRLIARGSIVWSGRPRQGLMLVASDTFAIPFSLLWCGFIAFWETSVLRGKAPLFMGLWGIPFILIGVYMLVGRFLVDAWFRSRTYYALTDRRVLILRNGPWGSFKALSLDRLPEATLKEGSNGRGTVRFGAPIASWGSGQRGNASYGTPALDPTRNSSASTTRGAFLRRCRSMRSLCRGEPTPILAVVGPTLNARTRHAPSDPRLPSRRHRHRRGLRHRPCGGEGVRRARDAGGDRRSAG